MGASKDRTGDGKTLGVGLVAAALILSLATAGIGLLYEVRYYDDAANSTSEYARYADQEIAEACRGVPEVQLVHCFSDARIKSELKKRDQQRDETDLVAQRKSALWATIMGVAAVFGMFLSAAGVLLVWRTFKAASEANDIARDAQRAWVKLDMAPHLVRKDGQGLYFHINFTAENIGGTVATHFDHLTQIFFREQNESIQAFASRVEKQVDEWKCGHESLRTACLVPKDIQLDRFVEDRQPPEVQWWKGAGDAGVDVTQIVFLAAVFYRTVSHPDITQLTWKSWYLFTFDTDGNVVSYLPRPSKDLGPGQMFVEPFRTSVMHDTYPAIESELKVDQDFPQMPPRPGSPRKRRVVT